MVKKKKRKRKEKAERMSFVFIMDKKIKGRNAEKMITSSSMMLTYSFENKILDAASV